MYLISAVVTIKLTRLKSTSILHLFFITLFTKLVRKFLKEIIMKKRLEIDCSFSTELFSFIYLY